MRTTGPKVAAAAPAPAVVTPRAGSGPLIAIGYFVLVIAAGGLAVKRATSITRGLAGGEIALSLLSPLIQAGEVNTIRDAIARSRMQRIDFAIQVYYLRNRGYPEALTRLVTDHLLKPSAIQDPLGRPFGYEVLPGGYKVSFSPTVGSGKTISIVNAPAADSTGS